MKKLRLHRHHMNASALAVMALASFSAAAQTNSTPAQSVTITNALGQGLSRQVEFIGSKELSELAPGSSPLVALSRLPSVNVQYADTFGSYEWSTRITVRGFNQNQLGFTLDDIPLGDMSYGNFNGLHISRAIATENISRSVLSAGTGSVSLASTNNLGGTVQFYSVDPARSFGVDASAGFGSNSSRHLFARLHTGQTELGRGYFSLTDQNSEKWKGEGERRHKLLNFKWVKDFENTTVSAFMNVSRRQELDDQDMSLQMVDKLGYRFDNTFPDFAAALRIASTKCGNTVNGVPSTYVADCDFAYYAGSGLRNDNLFGASIQHRFDANTSGKLTAYGHRNEGRGLWYTPYVPSPNGTPISIRTTEYKIDRNGVLGSVEHNANAHSIRASFWYEGNRFDQARRFYSVSPTNIPSPYDFPSNPFATQWQYAFDVKTTQFSLEDVISVSKELTANIGFKSVKVQTEAVRQIGDPASNPQGSISATKGFLPQLGLTYSLGKGSELFAGYAQNMRAFQSARTGLSPFSTTQAGFNAIASTLKPETSSTIEAGWRLNTADVEAVASVYFVSFSDRLLAIQQGPGIVGNPAVLANVGGAELKGLEVSASWRLAPGFSWYNGLNSNTSQYTSNYVSNGVTFNTKGKTLVDSPDLLFKSVFNVEQGALFGNLGMDYMSKRFYTYLNEGSVPERTLFNGAIGWKLGKTSGLRDATVQLNVLNLMDKRYISTVGSNGFVNSDKSGTEQTLLTGAPRSVFLSFSAKL